MFLLYHPAAFLIYQPTTTKHYIFMMFVVMPQAYSTRLLALMWVKQCGFEQIFGAAQIFLNNAKNRCYRPAFNTTEAVSDIQWKKFISENNPVAPWWHFTISTNYWVAMEWQTWKFPPSHAYLNRTASSLCWKQQSWGIIRDKINSLCNPQIYTLL